jgi:hypothetical protein
MLFVSVFSKLLLRNKFYDEFHCVGQYVRWGVVRLAGIDLPKVAKATHTFITCLSKVDSRISVCAKLGQMNF